MPLQIPADLSQVVSYNGKHTIRPGTTLVDHGRIHRVVRISSEYNGLLILDNGTSIEADYVLDRLGDSSTGWSIQ